MAEDAESAYNNACSEKPDLIILDRMLPGGDGLTVFRKLSENAETKEIPVLFLTAKRRESDIVEAVEQGAMEYIIKPFKIDDLISRCLRILSARKEKG